MEDAEIAPIRVAPKRRVRQIFSSGQNQSEEIQEGWRCKYCIAFLAVFIVLSVLLLGFHVARVFK